MQVLPYNIGIAKFFHFENKDLFQPVKGLEKNKRIPATGVINGLKTPTIFPNHDTKPWDMKVLDTKEVWSFGGKYGLSSLDLICMSLEIDSPKNGDVKGNNVGINFWIDNHEEIKDYCEKDVKTLIDIITKFNSLK